MPPGELPNVDPNAVEIKQVALDGNYLVNYIVIYVIYGVINTGLTGFKQAQEVMECLFCLRLRQMHQELSQTWAY